ncbi:MAG: hypothetical protein JO353_12165 [Phycisphaerae bacterium]|nr:hypothetical protein [Phycisphaerae bacterium]
MTEDTFFKLAWGILASGGGAGHLVYEIVCIKVGRITVERPHREYLRSRNPYNFWAGMILLTLWGGGFLTAGIYVLVHLYMGWQL